MKSQERMFKLDYYYIMERPWFKKFSSLHMCRKFIVIYGQCRQSKSHGMTFWDSVKKLLQDWNGLFDFKTNISKLHWKLFKLQTVVIKSIVAVMLCVHRLPVICFYCDIAGCVHTGLSTVCIAVHTRWSEWLQSATLFPVGHIPIVRGHIPVVYPTDCSRRVVSLYCPGVWTCLKHSHA